RTTSSWLSASSTLAHSDRTPCSSSITLQLAIPLLAPLLFRTACRPLNYLKLHWATIGKTRHTSRTTLRRLRLSTHGFGLRQADSTAANRARIAGLSNGER